MIARLKSWLGWWDARKGTIPRSRLTQAAVPQHLSSHLTRRK